MFYIYDPSTGLFTGSAFALEPRDDDKVASLTPVGMAVYEGNVDTRTQRLDLNTMQLVPHTPAAPSAEALAGVAAQEARATRDRMLEACDWVVVRAIDTGDAIPAAWQAYRQALRDVPEQPGFPGAVSWPEPPA